MQDLLSVNKKIDLSNFSPFYENLNLTIVGIITVQIISNEYSLVEVSNDSSYISSEILFGFSDTFPMLFNI